jgi:enoyl-CoA hydratase/carnithine racemase
MELNILDANALAHKSLPRATLDWSKALQSTFQEIWVEFATADSSKRVAYLYFDFYNGAMSTVQCSRLIEALDFIISYHTAAQPLSAVILMGGSYFSNGIALNVIEASPSPSLESWQNINRIDDVVHYLLHELPSRNITTVAALRGNTAAGGVALATACDIVVAGAEIVLNPAYRAIGLHGSEYHSLSYPGRCGAAMAARLLRAMLPLSAYDARAAGLVDHVLPGSGALLDTRIRNHVKALVCSGKPALGPWKANADVSPAGLAQARAAELAEMAKDFWSPRAERYHTRRRDFVRKVKASGTPLRFATHRRREGMLDPEESDEFDSVERFEKQARTAVETQLSRKFVECLANLVAGSEVGDKTDVVMNGKEHRFAGMMGEERGPVFSCYYST